MTADIQLFDSILNFTLKAKATGLNIPLFIWGEGGVGKTTRVKHFAEANDCHLEVLHAANQSPETLLGLEHKDVEKMQTTLLPPEWLARGMASKRRTIYFLDELNRAPKYVIQGLFSFINEGHLHTHHIKPGDIVIVAGNPDSNDYEVTGFEDKAFMSRFAHLYLEPHLGDVTNHFTKANVHEALLSTIKEDPTLVSTVCKSKVKITPTNRMLEKVGLALNLMEEDELTNIGYTLFSGMIGADTTSIIIKKAKDSLTLPDPKDILFNGNLKRVKADKMDIVTNTNIRLSKLLKETIDSKQWADDPAFKENCNENLAAYMQHIPKDSAIGFIDDLRVTVEVDVITDIIFAMPEDNQDEFLDIDLSDANAAV
jgi:hypothetical protein